MARTWAILVPVCPVCHQTISLVSRHLEANGIPTVILAAARDIVEHVGVARVVHTDFAEAAQNEGYTNLRTRSR